MTPFFRFRIILQTTRPILMPPQQGAVVYALICAANQETAQSQGAPKSFPSELMTDVPEVCRTRLLADEPFAFGGTILAANAAEATQLLQHLRGRLEQLGREGKPRAQGLGGNYRLTHVEDLVTGNAFGDDPLSAIPIAHLNEETERLLEADEVTLVLNSPIRIERPRKHRTTFSSYLDEQYFDLPMIVRMLLRRMTSLGIGLKNESQQNIVNQDTVRLLKKRVQWLDLAYGGPHGKSLGGLVGKIRLQISDPILKAALVWGQYARLGKNTAFGFGRYRIEELGPETFACPRSISLLKTAWKQPTADQISAKSGLDAGVLHHAIQQIADRTYAPHPVNQMKIGEGEKQRTLQIPSRRDRALQRLVLDAIAPGCDQLFESSSFAWRKGLGRHNSAKAITNAWRAGFRYAVNADFDRFFESIDHEVLEDRLHSYLQDADTINLIMQWVRSAVKNALRGIPTGAPLSPLLGNLMLDRFDEIIRAQNGRLVRYGDDFLILCRDEETALTLFQQAKTEADQLQLTLNDANPKVVDFDEPFRFLGFDFVRHEKWTTFGQAPRLLEELGWHDASRKKAPPLNLILPGETGQPASDFGLTAIVGPDATHLELRPDSLSCHYKDGRPQTVVPLADLETLVVLGSIGASAVVLHKLTDLQVHVILADDRGLAFAAVTGDYDLPHDVLLAQADVVRNAEKALQIARQLVISKIHNYAKLANVLDDGADVARRLAGLASKAADAASLPALRGIEGSAAAAWYGNLSKHLGKGFSFQTRVAPNAEDPVNVLLNIAQTHLHRLTVLAIRAAGLCSSLGMLHAPTGRFAALASDLQESFRFLMDRCVIEATWRLKPGDFAVDHEGPYPLKIKSEAARQFQLLLWKTLHLDVRVSDQQEESTSYLVQMQRQARRLRRYVLHGEPEFMGMRLP